VPRALLCYCDDIVRKLGGGGLLAELCMGLRPPEPHYGTNDQSGPSHLGLTGRAPLLSVGIVLLRLCRGGIQGKRF
jgi:hypothetical protein